MKAYALLTEDESFLQAAKRAETFLKDKVYSYSNDSYLNAFYILYMKELEKASLTDIRTDLLDCFEKNSKIVSLRYFMKYPMIHLIEFEQLLNEMKNEEFIQLIDGIEDSEITFEQQKVKSIKRIEKKYS